MDSAGLVITASGHTVEWTRDPVNVYAFHLQVPPRRKSHLDLEFEYASPLVRDQGRTSVTPDMVGLQWNTVVLYPAGFFVSRIMVAPSITICPKGWDLWLAPWISRTGAGQPFASSTVTLDTLVDSPLFTGRYIRTVDLDRAVDRRCRFV